jgi:ferredoxin
MTTRVEILNDFLAINVKPGATIQDIVEKAGSGLPFGCRDGECGTCVVEVVAGMEYLSPKTEKEEKVTNPCKTLRLSCQMKVALPNGHVRLKY